MTGKISEAQLKSELGSEKLSRVYFLYGEEDFLIRFYRDKIVSAAVPEDARDMNFVRYRYTPKADDVAVFLDSIPFMSEYKCAVIEDLNLDELEASEQKAYLSLIENVPESGVLIISEEHIDPTLFEGKKAKAKPKKLLAAAESAGVSLKLDYLPAGAVADKAGREIARAGCSISYENASYLAVQCGRSLTLLRTEVKKLCTYRQSGEITLEDIKALVPRRLDVSIYSLADELFAGHTDKAYEIFDELIQLQSDPHEIFGALAGFFVDLYRAKLGMMAKKNSRDVATLFKYPSNRAFVVGKAYNSARKLDIRYLDDCIGILYRTNKLLNSSKADGRILVEQAIADISTLKK